MKTSKLDKSKIKRFVKKYYDTTEQKLINEILADAYNEEQPNLYLSEVVQYGGINGAIKSLIYYEDTNKFWKKYNGLINKLLINGELKPVCEKFKKDAFNDDGEPTDNFKSHVCWFIYEYYADVIIMANVA